MWEFEASKGEQVWGKRLRVNDWRNDLESFKQLIFTEQFSTKFSQKWNDEFYDNPRVSHLRRKKMNEADSLFRWRKEKCSIKREEEAKEMEFKLC